MLDTALHAATVFDVDRLTIGYSGGRSAFVTPLENFSLALESGKITCILGPSGCGKTTLLKALGGLLIGEATGGVRYRGQYLTGMTPEIVMIFQENNLFPWLTVRQNIGFGLRFRNVAPAERQGIVAAILDTVGLAEAADRYPSQLSGGMRQRTAIARALVTDPAVLLLDEPFSALDITLRRRMHALLADIWQKTRKTMVMVTHNVEEAIVVGHRLIVLGDRPTRIMMDRDTSAPETRDRYDAHFLSLQKEIESAIN